MTLRDIFKFREVPETETSKPFLEHLEDLRWTIVKMAITLAAAMIVCFAFRSTLVRILQAPLRDVGSQIGTLKALGITDSIVISFHLAFYAGIVLSFPLLLYFIAEFVLPALTAVEKRFLLPAIIVSFALFLLGVSVCYFWLLPKTILFFFRDTESLGWAPTWTVQQYYSFVTRFTIGFGLAFELPVVVLALVRFGLITYRFMARTRPVRRGADLYSGDNHHAHTRHPDPDRNGAPDVPAVRKLHLDCMVNGAPQRTINCRIICVDHPGYKFLFNAFAFVLGAAVGSFLNVCIYRWPVDLSINKPRRSFCPACKQPIPWYQNLPLVSWILLGGRCANCGAKIAFRYFAVELITALLFLAIWQSFPWQMAIAYWIFASLLIVGTFIDLEHFIIPDRVTIGGIVAGVACSVAVPALMEADSRLAAGVRSLLAAALGYVILLIVLEAGKIAFGRKRIEFDAPTPFTWTKRGDDADLVVGTEESLWSDYFAREKDRLLLECEEARLDHHTYGNVTLDFRYDRVAAEGHVFMLDDMTQISGVARELVIPREAMGRGDLKFLAAIGAFLGWRAVLFSLFAGSLLGSMIGLITLVVGKRVWSAKLPFGPYLAFGALSWMFFGNLFLHWYAGLLSP